MMKNKTLIIILFGLIIANLLFIPVYTKFHKCKQSTADTVRVRTETVDTVYVNKKGTIKSAGTTSVTVDTSHSYSPRLFNVSAILDTLTNDSLKLKIQYKTTINSTDGSFSDAGFLIDYKFPEKTITKLITNTITIKTPADPPGWLYLNYGVGLIGDTKRITPGVYIGIGSSFKIF